ncbi:hypothetical protein L1987_86621 [Smallanthus sonchifolius]|uniref:Uncharacterized protein n=1 Tax=Smallanthus sonchifolius TaxID=185202 RepID=A0ACB8XZX6_9ASTR|nr:hypothetical protein L1987_86621 [Smallanthus sonchifolius]
MPFGFKIRTFLILLICFSFPFSHQTPKLGFSPSLVVVSISLVAPVFPRSRWCGGVSAVVAVSTRTGSVFGCLQRGTRRR